jgi:hypothetical protein
MNESRLNEIKHMFGTKWWTLDNEMELNKRLSAIKTYGKARQTYILDHYNNVFKYGSIYELELHRRRL